MSQDEALRLSAEVVDKSTGPLKNIAAMLRSVAREGQEHTETLGKGFMRLESGMKAASGTATSVLTPAMASIGVTALSVSAAIAGVGAAVRSFGSSAKEIGQLSRDTGIAADKLREVQGILGKVGVDAGQSGSALQQFAESARQARDGVGPIMEFLHKNGRTGEGHEYFMGLADRIKHAKDNTEAMMLALEGLEHVSDPAGRRKYAQEVLGMADAARLADGRLGSLRQQIESFRRINGVLTPQDIKDAEDYARAMDGLKGTMSKLGDAIARELTPGLTEAAKALKGFLDDQRNGVQGGLVTGLRDIKAELGKIDWAQAGEDSLAFFRETTALAGTLAGHLHTILEATRALREGDVPGALRETTGGNGTLGHLARRLAPKKGDDERDAEERVEMLRRGLAAAEHAKGTVLGRMGIAGAGDPEVYRQKLKEAEDNLRALKERTPDARQKDFEASEKLRKSLDRLSEKMDAARGGATVQQQSYDGGDGAASVGAMIQKAGLNYGGGGGATAVGRMLRGGGGAGIVVPDGRGSGDRGGSGGGYAPGGGSEGGYAPEMGDGSSARRYGPNSGPGRSGAILRGHEEPTPRDPRSSGEFDEGLPRRPLGAFDPQGGAGRAGRILRGHRGEGDVDIGGGMRGNRFGAPHPESGAGRVGAKLRGEGRVRMAQAGGEDSETDPPKVPAPSGDISDRMKMVYNGFRSAGFNHGAAKSLTAEVGRENSYRPSLLFGTHVDPHNQRVNAGMFSWQGSRGTALLNFLRERGLLNSDGTIQHSQESLNAQAEFAKGEMENPRILRRGRHALDVLNDPNSTHAERALTLGDDVIQWRQHDPRYAHHKAYRDRYYGQIGTLTEGSPNRPDILADPNDERRKPIPDIPMPDYPLRGPVNRRDQDGGQRFADFLRDRSRTKPFGSAEGEIVDDPKRVPYTARQINEWLDGSRRQAQDGDAETAGSQHFGDIQRRTNDPAYKPDRDLSLAEIREKYAAPKANGIGFAGAYRARQAEADAERKDLEFRPTARNALQGALRGGTVGATQNADRALLDVRVHNPGPNTSVSTKASGSIFREIQQTRGRQMRPAGEDV